MHTAPQRPPRGARLRHGLILLLLPLLGCVIHVHEAPASQTPAQPQAQPAPTPDKPTPNQPASPAKPTTGTPKPSTGSHKPSTDKPATDKPAADKPATDKPATDKPATDKPATDKPATDKPATDKPATDKPVTDKPGTDKPGTDKPIVVAPIPGKPDEGTLVHPDKPGSDLTDLVIPLRTPFDQVIASIDALVPKTEEEKEWTRVSKSGDSPEVEITYKVWRERILAKLEKDTLTVTVPLHYAAHFRAKVKNPLGGDWIWVTKDDTWGTQADPQDLTVTVTLKPHVEPTWEIKSGMKLESLVHGPAPKGDACVKVGIKACVSRESLAPSIRSRIDAYLTPKLEGALAKVDGELNKKLKLKAHAEKLWSAVQVPQPLQTAGQARCPSELGRVCKEPAWVVAQPTAIAVGPLTLDGKDLRIDFGLTGKLVAVAGEKPAVTAHPLPKVGSTVGKPHVAVNAELRLPVEWLTSAVAKGVEALHVPVAGKPALDLKGFAVTATHSPRDPRRVTMTAEAKGAVEGKLTVSGELSYDAAKRVLSVAHVSVDPETAALLSKALSPAEVAELEKQLAGKLSWDLRLAIGQLKAVAMRALGGTLKGELALSGDLDEVSVHHMVIEGDALALHLSLAGKLEAKYTPK
jgi:hypothetical protein